MRTQKKKGAAARKAKKVVMKNAPPNLNGHNGSQGSDNNILEPAVQNKHRKMTPTESTMDRIAPKTPARKGRPPVKKVAAPQVPTHSVEFFEDGNVVNMDAEGLHTDFMNETESDSDSDHEQGPSRDNNAMTSPRVSAKRRSRS